LRVFAHVPTGVAPEPDKGQRRRRRQPRATARFLRPRQCRQQRNHDQLPDPSRAFRAEPV